MSHLRVGLIEAVAEVLDPSSGAPIRSAAYSPSQWVNAEHVLDALLDYLEAHADEWEEAADDGFSTIRSGDLVAALRVGLDRDTR